MLTEKEKKRLQQIKETYLWQSSLGTVDGQFVYDADTEDLVADISFILAMLDQIYEENRKLKELLKIGDDGFEDDEKAKQRYANEYENLVSLALWAARRLPRIYKRYVYDEVDEITGSKHKRF